jgi:DNA mismatch endonuclease (patch repair protein)
MAGEEMQAQAGVRCGSRPEASSMAVSERMRRVATTGTQPELRLRSILHRRGLRYRLRQRSVAQVRTSPDLVFLGAMVAVFVDGCFWHGCPQHASWPKSNAEWWRQKIEHNRERDKRVSSALADAGWLVMRIWEHEDPVSAADRVEVAVRERRQPDGRQARRGAAVASPAVSRSLMRL